ncbi:MAG: undecaprenyl-diphosphatase [Parcubacteria bacterium C7867-003]|nr:MAG: undecaprenyl-diphosphatase [Parcubacteria bacterium C7867-003]
MTYLVAIILGFVQGATEFIPISSSGHLILVRDLLGENNSSGLAFDAVLQLSTSFAVLVYFWKDIVNLFKTFISYVMGSSVVGEENRTLFLSLFFGTLPAIFFGLVLESKMETIFRDSYLVAISLILGSLLIYYSQHVAKMDKNLNIKNGALIGFFQILALIPGVSRSGATISGGLILGLNKSDAVKFSFLLSFPILFGSGFKKLFDVRESLAGEFGLSLLLGSVVAFIVGFFAVGFLVKYLRNNNFNLFIWYRIALASLIILLV